ncbi:hypothetical protein CRUP_012129, partial [Coryphaenoides rupestris]
EHHKQAEQREAEARAQTDAERRRLEKLNAELMAQADAHRKPAEQREAGQGESLVERGPVSRAGSGE